MRRGLTLIFITIIFWAELGLGAAKKAPLISWYDPQITDVQDKKAQIRLSGLTLPQAAVSVDLSKIILISGATEGRAAVTEIQSTRSDEQGAFEIEFAVPYGILQIPIQVQPAKEPMQSILVIFEVGSNAVKINAKTIKKAPIKVAKEVKPDIVEEIKPKSEKSRSKSDGGDENYDLSLGLAYPTHKYSQKINLESDVSFDSGNAPALVFSGGGKVGSIGFDLGYSSSSGSIAAAAAPFVIKNGDYKWQNIALTGSYFFADKPKRNGNGSEIRFGYGSRQHPFLNINATTKEVVAVTVTENDAILGYKFKFGAVSDWLFEAGVLYRHPVSSSSSGGDYKSKSGSATELNFTVKTSAGEFYLLSGFVNLVSNRSSFEFKDPLVTTPLTGSLSFLEIDIGGSVGFSF